MCSYGIGVTSEEVVVYDLDNDTGLLEIPEQISVNEKGIEIFTNFKGQEYYAIYFSSSKVVFNDKVYKSPSAAGTEVQGGIPVNGWKFWKFIDENGKTYPIDRLRKQQ